MLDKVIGPDEEMKEKPKRKASAKNRSGYQHKGGELVQIDDEFNQPSSPSDLPTNNARTTTEEDEADYAYDENDYDDAKEGESSYDEEIYQDDFQDLLEEVLKEQAENDQDREDDPAFEESDTAWNTNQQQEESKAAANRSPMQGDVGNASDGDEDPKKPVTD